MNRRSFLSTLALGAAGFALDPERLLWRPGAKTIFLPPVCNLQIGDLVVLDDRGWRVLMSTDVGFSGLIGAVKDIHFGAPDVVTHGPVTVNLASEVPDLAGGSLSIEQWESPYHSRRSSSDWHSEVARVRMERRRQRARELVSA